MVLDATPGVDSAPDLPSSTPLLPLDECVTALRKGGWLLKHGRYGKPKLHFFRLINHDSQLAWRSANGARRTVDLGRVRELRRGQQTEVFRRYPQQAVAELSFSLLYASTDAESRSLDLICPGEESFTLWYSGLKSLLGLSIARPSHVLGKALGSQGSPLKSPTVASPTIPPSTASSPASLATTTSAAPVAGRVSGDIGLPIRSRTPGDLWLWGSPAPANRAAEGVGGGAKEQGRVAAMRFLQPHLVQETKQLDVLKVAVGLRHAALVTYTGDLYTWGEGRGGKLGHGHQADVMQPTRVVGLWGRRVTSVRCSESATAVVTDTQELYTWGDGAAGTLGYAAIRQHIPRQVPLPAPVLHVSLAQFHAAAVTAMGHLYTWGCGLGGKLGHGGIGDETTPRLVRALEGLQVLRVACGHWHTAAIVAKGGGGGVGRTTTMGHDVGHITAGVIASRTQSGQVYTWGGMVGTTGDPAGKDNHKGCLGVGDLQGRLLPTLVPGPLQTVLAVQVVAGLNFTAVVTSTHKVYQAGQLAPHRSVKWSSCTTFEQVGGPLERFWTDELTAGMQHCVATARAVDFKNGHPVPSGTRYVFTWGRGQEGQLGCGTCSESGVPVIVQAMQGRKVQQVAAGGYYAMAVCEHNSQSEDVEELQQLQVARDFFRHRFKGMDSTTSISTTSTRSMRNTSPSYSHVSPPLHTSGEGRSLGAAGPTSADSAGRDPLSRGPSESVESMEEESSSVGGSMVNGGRSETSRGGGNGRVVRSMTNIANRIGDRKNRKVLKSLRAQVSHSMTLPRERPPRPPPEHPPSSQPTLQRHDSMPLASGRQFSAALSSRSLNSTGAESGTRSPPLSGATSLRRVASGPEKIQQDRPHVISLRESASNVSLASSERPSSPGGGGTDRPGPSAFMGGPSVATSGAPAAAGGSDEGAGVAQAAAAVAQATQATAYARVLEARLAKLEVLLAQRVVENGALLRRLEALEGGGGDGGGAHRRELSFAEMALERASLSNLSVAAAPGNAYPSATPVPPVQLPGSLSNLEPSISHQGDAEPLSDMEEHDQTNNDDYDDDASSSMHSPSNNSLVTSFALLPGHSGELVSDDHNSVTSGDTPYMSPSNSSHLLATASSSGAGGIATLLQGPPGAPAPGSLEAAVERAAESGALSPERCVASPMAGGESLGGKGGRSRLGRRRIGETWTEEMEDGVHLNFEVKEDRPELVRIRFSKRRFTKGQAEEWYAANRGRLAARYSQALMVEQT